MSGLEGFFMVRFFLQLSCLFCLVLSLACNPSAGGQRPAGPQGPPEVSVVTITEHSVEMVRELPGRTAPYLIAEVRPQITGIVQARLFEEGQEVEAGQNLYQVDAAPYQAGLSNAEANLARAEANLASVEAKAGRYADLVTINAVSLQENVEAQAELKQASAGVLSARSALDTARIYLNYTQISAPISGRIGRSNITVGALVTANQPSALATIQQLDPIYVDVIQSTTELLELKRKFANGALNTSKELGKVSLLLEDGSVYPWQGKLKFTDTVVDQTTGSVTLRAVFPNPENLLLPGMYVRAQINEGMRDKAILAPQKGVSRNAKGEPTALVLGPDHKVEMRVLKTERTIEDNWLVNEGLVAGDQLIVEGLQKVRPGVEAKIADVSSASPSAGKH